jgi:hypothetical protein
MTAPLPVAQASITAAELEQGAVRPAEHLALTVRQLSERCRSTATPLHVRIQRQHAARAAEELERHLREAREQLVEHMR